MADKRPKDLPLASSVDETDLLTFDSAANGTRQAPPATLGLQLMKSMPGVREGDAGGTKTAAHTLSAADEGKFLSFDTSSGAIPLTIPTGLPDGARFYSMRIAGTNALQVRNGAGQSLADGEFDIVESFQLVVITIFAGGGTCRADLFATQKALDAAEVRITTLEAELAAVKNPATETKTAAYTLTDSDNLKRLLLDGTSAVVPLAVPDDLTANFSCHGRCVNAANAVTITCTDDQELYLMSSGGSVTGNGTTSAVVTVPVGATFTIDVEGEMRANVYVNEAP